jgi:RecA/RadA recombinase
MEKDLIKILSEIDSINPYATFLNESTISTVSDWIDTSSMPLNAVISGSLYGGIPRNRLTMISGESMSGKTFIVCKILANAQKKGLIPVIFDTENAIDKQTAENLGLDTSKVKYVPCFSVEQTRNSIYKFLTKAKEQGIENKFIVAIDSLGNLTNELSLNRMEKDSTSMDMGTRARSIKTLLNTCTQLAAYTKTTFIITNHLYDDPSAMYESIIKNQPGGKSVVYLPSVTVQLARKPEKSDDGKTMDGELVTGQKNFPGVILRALTVKNRFIQQYLQTEMYLSFKSGLDKYYGLLDLAAGFGVVIASGPTYSLYDGTKLGYYSKWRKDESVWEKILPVLEAKIKEGWAYGQATDEEIPDESILREDLVNKKIKIQPIETNEQET